MYDIKDLNKYIADLLRRKGNGSRQCRDYLVKAWA